MKKFIKAVYYEMQQHYFTFRILVLLKEYGITRLINHWITHSDDNKNVKKFTKQMLESQTWFKNNEARISRMLSFLSDEKSKRIWTNVKNYRCYGTQIPSSDYTEGDQYFVKELISIENGEVFVDGGAYTGDTIQQFINIAKRENICWGGIMAFEPDATNCLLIKHFFGRRKNIKIYNYGLANQVATLLFQENGVCSRLVEDEEFATSKVNVVSLDSMEECGNVSWIKMDIEGAEMSALYGAKQLILRNKPKLTICIYHSNEDMVQIIEYVHELVPEYKLYVRHHSRNENETVLYAVI